MSETPRTDKWMWEQECNYEVTWEEHCMQLETELADMRIEMNKWRDSWNNQYGELIHLKSLFASYIQSEEEASKLRKQAKKLLGL